MMVAVPEIEEDLPLPRNAAEALPDLSPHEELLMRARTIKLLSDITGQALSPTTEERGEAVTLAKQMIEDPKFRPEFSKYPNETMAYLAGLVAQTNCKIVDELSELKLYVVNRLVYEIENSTVAKTRISALAKLGEIDGVDAFKKRSEVTMNVRPIAEVEKELLSVLSNIEYRVVDPAERVKHVEKQPEEQVFEPESTFLDPDFAAEALSE